MSFEAGTILREQEKSFARIAWIAIASGFVGGFVAIMMVVLMSWLSNRSWMVDDADSHGISEGQSSRLGGVAVLFGAIAFFVVPDWALRSPNVPFDAVLSFAERTPDYFMFIFLIALVGLWDDLVARFSPITRLVLVLTLAAAALVSEPQLRVSSAFEWVPLGLNNPVALSVAGTLVVTGFVNAGNMADGANGLIGIVGISFLSVLTMHDASSFARLFIMALLIFVIFNVITGQIFLGDFGAYGLSAMVAFCSLELYGRGTVSLWFLGSVLAYPCIEMVRVIVSRASQGVSPLRSSNDHLHNYLYERLRNSGFNRISANSSTGCLLGLASAALPVCVAFGGGIDVDNTGLWGLYFGSYTVLHMLSVSMLKRALYAK